jgi:hypothetical protein
MNKLTCGLAVLGLLLSLTGSAQRRSYDVWNVGVRVGEPFAANFRSYFSERKALDVNVGLYGGIIGTNRNYGANGEYRRAGMAINVASITHFGLTGAGNIRLYYGLGGQLNFRRNYPDRLGGEYERRMSLGPTGSVGLEYIQLDSPYSFYAEGGLYLEALPKPLFTQLQLALGVRVKVF